ncbi:hypothetical protein IB277_09570 [Ensifer sp. ENS07]|uniref:hypothetical protein n=1 Tax=Ensifer sp. ENS07 TaxID=2769274 RepID=UPI001784CD71|nr:hypothetical protein [Ensifer sp. ENS07]MBD9636545.1 hypothetical protein [Ensifer sp. ENS07]
MDFRLVAGGMFVALLCAIAIVLFAPRTEQYMSYSKYEWTISALRKRPGAQRQYVEACVSEYLPDLKDNALEGTPYSSRKEMAEDVCRRYFKVFIDGRLTCAEFNRSMYEELPFSVVEEAERREPRPPRSK